MKENVNVQKNLYNWWKWEWKNNIIKKSQIFTMDPLKYLENKIMVTYPNPTKEHFANPYLTSLYSGLLFNSCC